MAENVPKALTPSAFTPFGGEFEYLAGEIVFVGDVGADDFIVGLSEALAQAIDNAARASAQPDRIRLHVAEGLPASEAWPVHLRGPCGLADGRRPDRQAVVQGLSAGKRPASLAPRLRGGWRSPTRSSRISPPR